MDDMEIAVPADESEEDTTTEARTDGGTGALSFATEEAAEHASDLGLIDKLPSRMAFAAGATTGSVATLLVFILVRAYL